MVRRLLVLLIAALTLLGLPGASAAFEDLAHGVVEGHHAHADVDADGDAHHPMHLEHGCGGGTHVCPCHAPTVATPGAARAEVFPANETTVLEPEQPATTPQRGVRPGVFRPPTS